MGFIILLQVQFLKFEPESQTNSVIACFITALLELAIFLGIFFYERNESKGSIDRPQYVNLQ
jgi:hypothetical protein